MIDEGDRLRPEACQSPIWYTGLAVLALRDSGLGPEHPALVRAADWLIGEEVTVKGDWAVRKPDLAAGGWAFEFENDLYPDVDDAAVVALALRRCHRGHEEVERGLAWAAGMQSRSGGWGAFDVDNEAFWLYKLPFCDFGKVTDEPTADLPWRGRGASTPSQTAWALLAYVASDQAESRSAHAAAEWLCAAQDENGDWKEEHYTGTGFPLDFMIRYHLYRLHFPLLALGRLRERLSR